MCDVPPFYASDDVRTYIIYFGFPISLSRLFYPSLSATFYRLRSLHDSQLHTDTTCCSRTGLHEAIFNWIAPATSCWQFNCMSFRQFPIQIFFSRCCCLHRKTYFSFFFSLLLSGLLCASVYSRHCAAWISLLWLVHATHTHRDTERDREWVSERERGTKYGILFDSNTLHGNLMKWNSEKRPHRVSFGIVVSGVYAQNKSIANPYESDCFERIHEPVWVRVSVCVCERAVFACVLRVYVFLCYQGRSVALRHDDNYIVVTGDDDILTLCAGAVLGFSLTHTHTHGGPTDTTNRQ